MFDPISGLPLHPLVVHATVVLVPLAGLLVAGAAAWPRLRRWAGWLPGALSVLAALLAWLTVLAGEEFERQLGVSVTEHAAAGRALRVWASALALVGLAVSWWAHRTRTDRAAVPRPVAAVIVAAGLVVGLAAVVASVQAGHSGAESVWGGVANP